MSSRPSRALGIRSLERGKRRQIRLAHPDKDYDYEAAKKAGVQPDERGHLPDTFKKPSHITFSDESKYSTKETPGGKWRKNAEGKWTYTPSAYVLSQHSKQELREYFKREEKDAVLILPGE